MKSAMDEEDTLSEGYTKYSDGSTEYYYRTVTELDEVRVEIAVMPGDTVTFSVRYEIPYVPPPDE